jgi:hypothetical protein
MCGDGEHVDLSELLHRSDLSGDSLTVTFSRINSRIGQLPLMFSRITLTFSRIGQDTRIVNYQRVQSV